MKLPVFIGLLGAILLVIRFSLFYTTQPRLQDGQEVILTQMIRFEPDRYGNLQRFSLDVGGGERISIVTPRFPIYHYGQTVRVSGTVTKRVLDSGRVINTIQFPDIATVKTEQNIAVFIAQKARERIRSVFLQALPPVSAGLLLGIIFGGREQLPEEFTDRIADVGLMHVIAASGMNVSMVAGSIFALFATLIRRQYAIVLSIFAVWAYVFLAGFSASIVRAGLMASLAFAAALLGRQYLAFYALFVTAYLMLLWEPSLVFDLGFQLSSTATLGIILISPHLPFAKRQEGVAEAFRTDIATTTAAQIATLPVILYAFGSYGLLSVPVNALVLWTIPIVMLTGGIAAVLAFFLPLLAKAVLYLTLPFLLYFEYVVIYMERFNWSLDIAEFPMPFVLGYYLLLFAYLLSRRSPQAVRKEKMRKERAS